MIADYNVIFLRFAPEIEDFRGSDGRNGTKGKEDVVRVGSIEEDELFPLV